MYTVRECQINKMRIVVYKDALKSADTAIRLDPDWNAYHLRAQAYLGLNQLSKALSDANTALKLPTRRSRSKIFATRSLIHAAMGRKDLAKADSVKADEDSSFVYENAPFRDTSLK